MKLTLSGAGLEVIPSVGISQLIGSKLEIFVSL